VLRPLSVTGQEFDRAQIEEAAQESFEAVFRVTELTLAVVDSEFSPKRVA